MKEPRGLLRFMVALKPSSEEGLVGHFPDGRPATAKRILLSALMAEVGELEDSQFNSSPVRLPEPVKVASLDSQLDIRSDAPDVGVDVLTLHVDELRVLVFVGLLEKAVVRTKKHAASYQ